jgi:hypothetical protein
MTLVAANTSKTKKKKKMGYTGVPPKLRERRGVTLVEEEGLHWCVPPKLRRRGGLHWCVQAATPQRTPGIPESCERRKKRRRRRGVTLVLRTAQLRPPKLPKC